MWIGLGILGNYCFGYTAVFVLDKVVSYDHNIVGAGLHIFLVVDIDLGQLSLANNVLNLVLDNHLIEYRVVGMEPVVTMNAALVEVDTLVVEVVGTVDTAEAILLCVGAGFGQVRYVGF